MPAPGCPGVFLVPASELPPTRSKWIFPELPCVTLTMAGRKYQVTPEDLEFLPRSTKPSHFAFAGVGHVSGRVFVSAKGAYNAGKALFGRALQPAPEIPEPGIFLACEPSFRYLLPGFCGPVGYERVAWIQHLQGPRRKVIRQAAEAVDREGFSREWLEVDAFVKTEKLNGSLDIYHPLVEMLDRLIQAPRPEGLVIVAPYMWKLTKRLKNIWNSSAPIFYAAVAPELLSDWFNANYSIGLIAVCADYAKFDNSHSEQSWAFMERLYGECHLDQLVKVFLAAWRKPKGKMTGRGWCFRYQADYMNASGRPDTALANALLNGVVMFTCLAAIYNDTTVEALTQAQLSQALCDLRLSVVGDDSLALLPRCPQFLRGDFPQLLSSYIARFGFSAKGEKMVVTDDPFEMVYLGMRPYPVAGRWHFARTIGRYYFKAGYCLDPKADLGAWYAGNCLADLPGFGCVPVLRELCTRVLEYRTDVTGKSLRYTPVAADANRPWKSAGPTPAYDNSTVEYLARGYQVPEQLIRQSIHYHRNLPAIPWLTDDPFIARTLEVDAL